MKLAIAATAALFGALTATSALADGYRSQIISSFERQGYDDVRVWRQGGRWMVSAERGNDDYTFRVDRASGRATAVSVDDNDDTPRRGNRGQSGRDDDRNGDSDNDRDGDRDDDRENDRDNDRDDDRDDDRGGDRDNDRDDDRDNDRDNDRDDDRDDDRGGDRDGDDD
jgi:hypothetical protein